jgi:phage shock protein PspC (stress-responsive transcriptional regulator)
MEIILSRKVRRIPDKGWFGGVCAGFAYFIGVQVWLIRILWVCMVLFAGFGVLPYILFWAFVPQWRETPPDFDEITGD